MYENIRELYTIILRVIILLMNDGVIDLFDFFNYFYIIFQIFHNK